MERFSCIIGQNSIKDKLNFYLDIHEKSNISPNFLFVAPRGSGKTTIAKEYARNLMKRDKSKKKPLIEINCATLTSAEQFFNDIYVPAIHGKEVTILFDEASELPKNLQINFLSLFNPNPDNRNILNLPDYSVEFDFSIQSFLFCTTEPQLLFHALLDRLERVELEDYSGDDLSKIIKRNINCNFEEGVLQDISSCLRGNARQAQSMANRINSYLKTKDDNNFGFDDWQILKKKLAILPLGLTHIELKVMHALKNIHGMTLTNLSAITGMTRASLQRDFEIYLLKNNLIQIAEKGRMLTGKGHEYLKQHEESKREEEAPF
jgi:Holliday junction resolvasome RuvABC ATP-dependent DNA helicase subunit